MADDTIIISPAMNPGGDFKAYALQEKGADEIMSLEKEAYNDAIIKKFRNNIIQAQKSFKRTAL
jgi:hypothetical protein